MDRAGVFFVHTVAPTVYAVIVPITVLTAIGLGIPWMVALAVSPLVLFQLFIAPRLRFATSVGAFRSISTAQAELARYVTDTVQGMNEIIGHRYSQERLDETARIDAEITGTVWPTRQWATVR